MIGLLLALLGCGPAAAPGGRPGDPAPPVDTSTAQHTGTHSDGSSHSGTPSPPCPELIDGATVTIEVDGAERGVHAHLPDAPTGATLIFWYGADQSPAIATSRAGLARLADEHGVAVLIPIHDPGDHTTWRLEPDSPDVRLFDRMVECAVAAGADPNRLHLGGYSIGALFADYLLQHRADLLAGVVSASGGINQDFTPWLEPSADVPVLLTWGGAGDVNHVGTAFEPFSLELAALLRDSGHLVVECVHSEGHSIPDALHELLVAWTTHIRGQPSPWSTTTAGLPAICAAPEYLVSDDGERPAGGTRGAP